MEGDKRKLRDTIASLVSNALKYLPPGEGGTVSGERQNDAAHVAVADAGSGLYIVKQVVDLHEGDGAVESAPREGSTFSDT